MTVKELYKKYKKDYCIILYGENKSFSLKDCIKKVTPFSFIYTTDKNKIDNMEVLEIIIKDYDFETIEFDSNLQYKSKTKYKGDVYALVRR